MNLLRPRPAVAFRSRFAFEALRDGGVLVDLRTGNYFSLNGIAARACAILDSTEDDVVATALIAESLHLTAAQSIELVDDMLGGLPDEERAAELVGPFRYAREGDDYILRDGTLPVMSVDPRASKLRLLAPPERLRFRMLEYVRAVAPKLLGLFGISVLHAATCSRAGVCVAFSGQSGAGKTTTAGAFVQAGATPISEDLVVLADPGVSSAFWLEGERRTHLWADRAARQLSKDAGASILFADLVEIAGGATGRLEEMWFIDANRRAGHEFNQRPLDEIAGLLALLGNTFLGADDGEAWHRHLRWTRALASQLRLFEVTTPAGLRELSEAASGYRTNSASY